MVVEIALSVALVAVSALLIQSLMAVQRVPLGFDPSHVFTLQFRLPQSEVPEARGHRALLQERDRTRARGAGRRVGRAGACRAVQRQRRHRRLRGGGTSGSGSRVGAAGALPPRHAGLLQDAEDSRC